MCVCVCACHSLLVTYILQTNICDVPCILTHNNSQIYSNKNTHGYTHTNTRTHTHTNTRTYTHALSNTRAYACAPPPPTHTHTLTHMYAHTNTHTHTHTHTHTPHDIIRVVAGWLINVYSISGQGQIYIDSRMSCHSEIEVVGRTCNLTQLQYTDTWSTSPSADPITPGTRQGSHWSGNFEVTGMTYPGKCLTGKPRIAPRSVL